MRSRIVDDRGKNADRIEGPCLRRSVFPDLRSASRGEYWGSLQEIHWRDIGRGCCLHWKGREDQQGPPFKCLADIVALPRSRPTLCSTSIRQTHDTRSRQKNRAFKKLEDLRNLDAFVARHSSVPSPDVSSRRATRWRAAAPRSRWKKSSRRRLRANDGVMQSCTRYDNVTRMQKTSEDEGTFASVSRRCGGLFAFAVAARLRESLG